MIGFCPTNAAARGQEPAPLGPLARGAAIPFVGRLGGGVVCRSFEGFVRFLFVFVLDSWVLAIVDKGKYMVNSELRLRALTWLAYRF